MHWSVIACEGVQGLKSPLPEKRQGVCLGLSEVIGAATRKQLEDFLPVLIPAVQEVKTCQSLRVCVPSV